MKNKKKFFNFFSVSKNKAQGEVISTILLVMIAIAAIVVIFNFAIPFVKDKLKEKECFDYNGILEIVNSDKYTCYHKKEADTTLYPDDYYRLIIRVKIGDLEEEDVVPLKGFQVIVNTDDKPQQRFTITKSGPNTGVVSYSGDPIDIPDRNGERTYNLTLNTNLKPNSTIIYPILENEKECSTASYTLDSFPNC